MPLSLVFELGGKKRGRAFATTILIQFLRCAKTMVLFDFEKDCVVLVFN